MKMQDLLEKQEQQKGTYAGIRYDKATTDAIAKYIKDNNIPNAIKADKIHTTLLYSRKHCPDYIPGGMYKKPYVATPEEFAVWETNPDAGPKTKCLILKLKCQGLVDRHNELMKEHGATYDYAQYQPHVTLSYDIEDLDVDKLPDIRDTVKQLNAVEEYGEDLDLNWTKTKGVDKK